MSGVLCVKTKQFYDPIMQTQVNTQKPTKNPMSSFGLIEENMKLSHIHLAVISSSVIGFLSELGSTYWGNNYVSQNCWQRSVDYENWNRK